MVQSLIQIVKKKCLIALKLVNIYIPCQLNQTHDPSPHPRIWLSHHWQPVPSTIIILWASAISSSVSALVYMANYTSGLRIVRLEDPATASMTEVGFFDQIPGEPSLEFAGSFSVYPFFDSGTIVMSSMGEGLFILRPEVVPTR